MPPEPWIHCVKARLLFPQALPCKDSLSWQAGILAEAGARGSWREVTNTHIAFVFQLQQTEKNTL